MFLAYRRLFWIALSQALFAICKQGVCVKAGIWFYFITCGRVAGEMVAFLYGVNKNRVKIKWST